MSKTSDEFVVRDTGKDRRVSATGCERDNRAGKGRYDLLPVFALERDARLYEKGAEKYTARNWELGQYFSWCLDSAKRHIDKVLMGDRVEDNLAASRFHLACVMHYEEMIKRGLLPADLDDLPSYAPPRGALCDICGMVVPRDGSCMCRPQQPETPPTEPAGDGMTDDAIRALHGGSPWKCERCKAYNSGDLERCGGCHQPKPPAAEPAGGRKLRDPVDVWPVTAGAGGHDPRCHLFASRECDCGYSDSLAALKLEYDTAATAYNEWKKHKPNPGTSEMVEYNAAWSKYDLAKFRYRDALDVAEARSLGSKLDSPDKETQCPCGCGHSTSAILARQKETPDEPPTTGS